MKKIVLPTKPCSARLSASPLCPQPSRRTLLASGLALPALLSSGLWRGSAALARAKDPRAFNARVIQSGHSLTDPIVPELDQIVRAAGGTETLGMKMDRSTIPGSPMEFRWNERNTYLPDARTDIADYDVLVITERVPLSNTLPWHASEEYGLKFFANAWTKGNGGRGAETILYASWVPVDSGPGADNPYNDPEAFTPFRERMDLEMVRWEQIQASVNANRPKGSPAMPMIPGPLVMAAIHDALRTSGVPGLKRMEDLFEDTIHVNAAGAFIIALAHYAVIYRRDPRELPAQVGRGRLRSPESLNWMKAMVWDVVSAYPGSGLA
ncbi:MAG: hypothetical protein C0524_09635 [Rhodobacter sp.]|nr:hypothetical protein [Rhodobacter sp.]